MLQQDDEHIQTNGTDFLNFMTEFLIGAVYKHPIVLLSPIIFAAIWSLWCALTDRFKLLKKGSIGVLALFAGSLCVVGLFLSLALGALGGAEMGLGTEILGVILIVLVVAMYYGIIPFLLVITLKARVGSQ